MIWRRIKVSSDSTIADLHYIIQIVMGWKEEHLHQFLIHGVHYGISYILRKMLIRFPTMGSVIVVEKESPHLLSNQRSIK
jgi:hypothetical protein